MKEVPAYLILKISSLTVCGKAALGLWWEKSSSNQIVTDGCLGEWPLPFFVGLLSSHGSQAERMEK